MPHMPDIQDLDEDLAQLARHRLGFQRPGALIELRHLLSLSVIEKEAGAHFDIPEARVLALRTVLETVIERMSNPTTRQALKILFFLDEQRPELRASTLSARRTEIVHRLPFQDEQWRRGLEDRFRALLAGELRSYEVEHRLAHMSVLPPDTVPAKAVRTTSDLRTELNRIVDEARECLTCLGSRSREVPYLDRIVAKLTHEPHVAHYRMMWGQPHHEVFITHLRRLLAIQALSESQDSSGRIRLGMVAETSREPERFIVANEREALFVIPPEQVGNFSSAVIFHDEGIVGRCKAYVSDLYNYCHQLTLEDVEHMHPLHIAA